VEVRPGFTEDLRRRWLCRSGQSGRIPGLIGASREESSLRSENRVQNTRPADVSQELLL